MKLPIVKPKFLKTRVLSCFLAGVLCLSACKSEPEEPTNPTGLSGKSSAKTSAQPLPGGKARFTWVNGNFDLNGYSWQRIVNLSFTASNGTVGATLYTWRSDVKAGKAAFNSHFCTFDGVSKTCNVYTPGGWVYPTGQYVSWSGTYVYNTTTGKLDITWTSGASATESWQITNPTSGIARASLLSSSYTLTHGRGYGSNAAWSTYKTITQIINGGLPNFTQTNSRSIGAGAPTGTSTPTLYPSNAGFQVWGNTRMDLSIFSTPSSPSPANTLHYWSQGSTACTPSACNANPRPGVTGIVYHLASNNNGRAMVYNNFCACLSHYTEWPCYPRALHPLALTQIIDDNNNLVALIGIEAQNEPGYANYLFQLVDFNNIP